MADASRTAMRSGEPVEVVTERTETDTVYANPDGSLTRTMSTEPIRARVQGEWQDLDLDLVVREGRVAPSVGATDVSFSNGGAMDLVEVSGLGSTVAVQWPGELPEPEISGPTARYVDVFPDVDLLMTATPAGYTHVLEVGNADAASSPALAEIPLGISVDGPGTVETRAGGFSITDEFGRDILVSPDSLMWDSSGVDGTSAMAPMSDIEVPHQPAEGATQVLVEVVDSAPGEITLVPDQEMLQSDDTVFPVFIDPPAAQAFNQAGRAMVFKEHPNLSSWNWGNETAQGGQGVGYQTFDGVSTKRLFWQFNLGTKIAGATVSSATFMAKEVWAASCTKKPIHVYRTGQIKSTTSWNNQPSWAALQDTKTVSFGRQDCPADQAGDRVLNFDVAAAVQNVARNGDQTVTFGLRADESDPVAWKRFAPRPNEDGEVLRVNYSFPPGQPFGLALDRPSKSCDVGANRPVIGNDAPDLGALATDKDRSRGELVKMRFELWSGASASRIKQLGVFTTGFKTNYANEKFTVYKMPQADVAAALPTTAGKLGSGTYSWRPTAIDEAGLSTAGPWCEFRVDLTRPGSPELIGVDETEWVYASGVPATVKFGPGEATDVVKYAYAWNSDTAPTIGLIDIASDPRCTVATQICDVQLALPKSGMSVLRLWSYDAASNPTTAPAEVRIEDGSVNLRGLYRFNDASAPGRDWAEGGLGATLTWGASATRWFRGTNEWPQPIGGIEPQPEDEYALRFHGAGVATGPSMTPIVETDGSFTVAAWIDPAEVSAASTAVSQFTNTGSAFRLGVDPDCVREDGSTHPCYVFSVKNSSTGTWTSAQSELTANVNPGYIQVTGVYAEGKDAIVLYIDGEQADYVTLKSAPPVSTRFLLGGSATSATSMEKYFRGDLDDVRLYAGAADPTLVNVIGTDMAYFSNDVG